MKEIWKGRSYAKINLGLHILERLPNGYHRIETAFAFINWADRFEIEEAKRTQILFPEHETLEGSENLVNKAVELLRQEAGLNKEFKISIHKVIPAGAGLGGGSSNAAFTLNAINKIADLGLSYNELVELGSRLGADVPFFLSSKPAIGKGTGTELSPADIQPKHWIVTAFPKVHSSTAEAYQFCQPMDGRPSILPILQEEEVDEWRILLENDLEPVVMSYLPDVGHFKDRMYDMGASYAAMSGSGAAVFGVFEQEFVASETYQSYLQLDYPACLTTPDFKPDQGVYLTETHTFEED